MSSNNDSWGRHITISEINSSHLLGSHPKRKLDFQPSIFRESKGIRDPHDFYIICPNKKTIRCFRMSGFTFDHPSAAKSFELGKFIKFPLAFLKFCFAKAFCVSRVHPFCLGTLLGDLQSLETPFTTFRLINQFSGCFFSS